MANRCCLIMLTLLTWSVTWSLPSVGWSASDAKSHSKKSHSDKHDTHQGDSQHGDPTMTNHIANANAGESQEDPTEFKSSLAIWSAVVFLLLMTILIKFAWKPISEGLDKREKSIADNIRAAEEANEEAKRMIADYEAKLAAAADEVRELLDEARRDAEHTKEQILAEAKTQADAEHARQKREIEVATNAALKQLAESSANMAVDLAGRIIQQQLKPSDHQSLIKEAIQKFPSSNPSNN